MSARLSLRSREQPVRDLLADLTQQTGVQFFAEPAVADDRVTIWTLNRRLGETLGAMANLLRFEWRRSGEGKTSAYTLAQDAAEVVRQEVQRRRRLEDSAAMVFAEAEALARLGPMKEADAIARASSVGDLLATEINPDRQRALHAELAMCRQYASRAEWRLVGALLRKIGEAGIRDLMLAGTTDYSWPKGVALREFPEELAIALMREATETPGIAPGELRQFNFVRLRFTGDAGRTPSLSWQLTVGRRNLNGYSANGFAGTQPVAPVAASTDETFPPGHVDWRSDPLLSKTITLSLGGNETRGAGNRTLPFVSLGTALHAVAGSSGVEFVSDAFLPARVPADAPRQMAAGEAIEHIARVTEHAWWIEDGLVRFRSRTYASDRWSEPPAISFERWAQLTREDRMELDDYAEIAGLPPQQFQTLYQMALRGAAPGEWATVGQGQVHLAFWNLLSREQRRHVLQTGLKYSLLTREQKAAFERAAMHPSSGSILPLASFERPIDQILDAASVRVEIREQKAWGVRRAGTASSMTSASNREEAFSILRQSDPSLSLKDIRGLTSSSVRFHYESSLGSLARGYLMLPYRWDDAD